MVLILCPRMDSVEKSSPLEKKYEPVPQMTPSVPPATLPKPPPDGKLDCSQIVIEGEMHTHTVLWSFLADVHYCSTAKPPAREDTVQTNFLPHKSFPEKSPVNGTSEQPPKTVTSTGALPATSYNRFVPKPYTTSAKPFARMFDSPKFNHNLLPNDKPESAPKVNRFWPEVTQNQMYDGASQAAHLKSMCLNQS